MTPQQRSRKLLKDAGYHVATVEHWCSFTRRRKDLFNFGDLLAIKAGEPPLIVQVTSGSNTAARIKKIAEIDAAKTCLAAGMLIEVHGWRKLKTNRNRWTPRIEKVTAEMLEP